MTSQVVTVVLTLVLSILIARCLGPAGNGIVTLTLLFPTVLTIIWNLGIAPANAYYLAKGDVSNRVALKSTLLLSLLVSLVGIGAAVPVVWFGAHALFPGVPSTYLWWMLLVFPIGATQAGLAAIFQGAQDFRPYKITVIVTPAANLLAAILLVWWLKLGPAGALLAFALGQLSTLAATCGFLIPYLRRKEEQRGSVFTYARAMVKYGSVANFSNILGYVNYRIDVFCVGKMLGNTPVGVYSIAVNMAERFWVLSYASSAVILPRLSELNKDEQTRRALTPVVGRWVLLLTATLSLVIIFAGKPLIRLLFGKAYLGAYGIILILLPGIVVFTVSRVLANDIAARGRVDLNFYAVIAIFFVNLIANLMLIPRMGLAGGALSTTIGYAADTAFRLVVYAKLSGNKWWRPLLPEKGDWHLLRMGGRHVIRKLNRGRKGAQAVSQASSPK